MKFYSRIRPSHIWISLLCIICFTFTVLIGMTQSTFAFELNAPNFHEKITKSSPYGLCLNQEEKIDLNNANIIAFQDCPGFYPSLASIIIQNSPYQSLDDVLMLENLTEPQKEALEINFENFKLSKPITDLSMRMPPRPSMRSNP